MSRTPVLVIGARWLDRRSELAFVTRSIAGAASRSRAVAVLVPGERSPEADGAFELRAMGKPGALRWPSGLSTDATVIVDELTPEIAALLAANGSTSVWFLSAADGTPQPGWRRLPVVGGDNALGVHVPVNRLAEQHRHHGFGFTDYLLVLSDRTGLHAEPPPAAAWLSAAFADADVVVVENAMASAWKGRALRGTVSVDTRMDLWRLLAHARVCVDLAPGPHIARDCVEAMRFGRPIIVPDGRGPGPLHSRATGGATFRDASELLHATATFGNEAHRAAVAASSREYADGRYGDPVALVKRLDELLGGDEMGWAESAIH